jgi:cupin fold WbuC family metalloprotein
MENEKGFPLAFDAPVGSVVTINDLIVRMAIEGSRESPRKRMILPFHEGDDDPLQRMLNVLQPGSYVQPHRHLSPPKAEPIIVLRGALQVVTFDEAGRIERRINLRAGSGTVGVDIRPGVFHTFFALEEDTVLFEVKPGPYEALSDKDFASWAPKEGTPEASLYLKDLIAE